MIHPYDIHYIQIMDHMCYYQMSDAAKTNLLDDLCILIKEHSDVESMISYFGHEHAMGVIRIVFDAEEAKTKNKLDFGCFITELTNSIDGKRIINTDKFVLPARIEKDKDKFVKTILGKLMDQEKGPCNEANMKELKENVKFVLEAIPWNDWHSWTVVWELSKKKIIMTKYTVDKLAGKNYDAMDASIMELLMRRR